MIAPDIAAFSRAGIRSVLEVWLLLLAGHAGTPGMTTPRAASATGQNEASVRQALARLAARGFLTRPSRDTGMGTPCRHTITPAGLALLQTQPAPSPASEMKPLPLPVAV